MPGREEVPDKAVETFALELFGFHKERLIGEAGDGEQRQEICRMLAFAAPFLRKQGADQERQRIQEALSSEARSFRAEADQHDREAAEPECDEIEAVRHRGSAATWRAAADSLEKTAILDTQEADHG